MEQREGKRIHMLGLCLTGLIFISMGLKHISPPGSLAPHFSSFRRSGVGNFYSTCSFPLPLRHPFLIKWEKKLKFISAESGARFDRVGLRFFAGSSLFIYNYPFFALAFCFFVR